MAIKGLEVATVGGSGTSPQTLEQVKKRILADLTANIAAAEKGKETKRGWLAPKAGQFLVAVKYGVQPIYYAEGMEAGRSAAWASDEKEAAKIWRQVQSAVKKGELDDEVNDAWNRAKRSGRGRKKAT